MEKLKSANHVLSECSKLAQKKYKRRHDWVGTKIHWELYRKYGIEVKQKWHEHQPEVVMKNDKCKILWNFTVQTDHEIYGGKIKCHCCTERSKPLPDNRFCLPYNGRVDTKELEK